MMRLQADGLPTLTLQRVADDPYGERAPRLDLVADSLADLLAWHDALDIPALSAWASEDEVAYVELRGGVKLTSTSELTLVDVTCMAPTGSVEMLGLTGARPWIPRQATIEQARACAGAARGSG